MAILSVMVVVVVVEDFCAEVSGGDSWEGDRGREFLESDLAVFEAILRLK